MVQVIPERTTTQKLIPVHWGIPEFTWCPFFLTLNKFVIHNILDLANVVKSGRDAFIIFGALLHSVNNKSDFLPVNVVYFIGKVDHRYPAEISIEKGPILVRSLFLILNCSEDLILRPKQERLQQLFLLSLLSCGLSSSQPFS